jgi:thioredoxin-related protein
VIIFFHPECEYCAHEAKELNGVDQAVSDTRWLFLSNARLSKIRDFGEQHGLIRHPGFYLYQVSATEMMDYFGLLSVPHIFIYNASGDLLKEYSGEIKKEEILKYL